MVSNKYAAIELLEPGICPEAETSIVTRFSQIADHAQTRVALAGSMGQMTYGELELASNRLAHAIISRGGAPGSRIAVMMRHDAPMIVSALAVLKGGGVVVVLNPTDPPERLKQILDDSEATLLITDSVNHAVAKEIAQKIGVLHFGRHESAPSHEPGVNIDPHDLAWLLYTSGSTGRPKGVMQTHRNLVHNMLRLSRGMEITPADKLVLLASPSGGQGVATTWCALLNGASLFPFPVAEQGVARLKHCLREQKISVCVASPSVFRQFINALSPADFFPDVRLVRFGSEPIASGELAAARKYFPPACAFLNSLSASETGNVTRYRFESNETFSQGNQPVGWPVFGNDILLENEDGGETADGQTGEIIVRSRYLSPGYWRNESLTAARFSSGTNGGIRAFRTGDLARRLPDGSMMFMGRKDARVKINGYRVEISEIEDALARLPEVSAACVSSRTVSDCDVQLIAHVILRSGGDRAEKTLRRGLRKTLPGYMVPAHFVFLERFPLTPHGKIDRQALPAPSARKKTMRRSERPRDIVERRLAKIWEDVLGISPIGVRDDFFDLGGTSLQSAEVLRRIEEALGASLSPSTLTEHSTLQQLATLLIEHAVIPSASPLVTLRASGNGRPLFLIHSGQGDLSSYGLLVRRLPDRPIYGLQSIGLQGEAWPLLSVEAMARRYLPEIIAKDPEGPYLLAATCMGGLVAFELARLLVQEGRQVALTALFDTHYPLPAWRQKILLKKFYGPLFEPVRDGFRMLWWAGVRSAGFGRNPANLREYRRFIAHMNRFATRNFRPGFYPGELTLFHTSENIYPRGDGRMLMKNHAQSVRVIPLPGKRAGLFVKPAVDELARELQKCLEDADAEASHGKTVQLPVMVS